MVVFDLLSQGEKVFGFVFRVCMYSFACFLLVGCFACLGFGVCLVFVVVVITHVCVAIVNGKLDGK